MSASPNLKLPYIDANQNQKSVTHNEALRILDALVNLHVVSNTLSAPPAMPADGQRWIVASGGSGAWLGKDLDIAAWQDGAWTFYAPNPGFVAYVDAIGGALMWNGTAWVSLLNLVTQLALNTLGIGTAADPANPLAAKLNSALFTALPTTASPAGTGSLRVALSKQAASNTASILFQDNYSGRAEFGLTGDDNFHMKVSPDGSTFYDAIVIAAAGGGASFLASPTAPTPSTGDASSKLATTGFVAASFLTYAYASATYATLSNASLTGTPTAPTQARADNSTRLATTAYADRAASANFARTQVNDAAYAVLATDRTVAVTALTAARTLTLPAASAYPQGATLTLVDESGACSAANTITIAAAGADTINGAANAVLSAPFSYLALESNASNKWTVIDANKIVLIDATSGTAYVPIDQAVGYTIVKGGTNGTLFRDFSNNNIFLAYTTAFRPGADNTQSLGLGSFRWSTVYAGTGTINTSDATEKSICGEPSEAVFDAVLAVPLVEYQWNDAVAKKGPDGARLHFGATAQAVHDAFAAHGLDPRRYALFCEDDIVDRSVPAGLEGEALAEAIAAAQAKPPVIRYGIRYDQFDRLRQEAIRRKLVAAKLI